VVGEYVGADSVGVILGTDAVGYRVGTRSAGVIVDAGDNEGWRDGLMLGDEVTGDDVLGEIAGFGADG
jgi:hypothetical protein